MQSTNLGWSFILGGIAALGLGGYVLYSKRKTGRKPTKSTTELGFQEKGRLVTQLWKPTPVVEETRLPNGMKVQHRRSWNMPIEERVANIQDLVWKSVLDPEMRKLALAITHDCPERDGKCEAEAIYKAIKKRIRYTGDVAPLKIGGRNGPLEPIDFYQSAKRTFEFKGGDCLPQGTLLLNDKMEFVPIEKLVIGSKIWGRDSWTEVKDVWSKGVMPVDTVFMNNGSYFKATADHKVYVALCHRHANRTEASRPCSCPIEERSIERISVSKLEPDMVLIQPDHIDFGTDEMDPRRAYIEGLYLSDGWMSHASDFEISGKDGFPKEAQKHAVKEICDALGIETRWHHKYIAVKDSEWAHQRITLMGHVAPEKHALSINLTEAAARELLRGILADSGKNTKGNGRTFTSTSRELTLQTRVLCRMLGISCNERYIVDHGGLGENPVWRLGLRDQMRSDGYAEKLLRVKAVERDVMELPTYDLQTADHYVYLPEADVVVSNCDDHAILSSTLLTLNGITARLRVTKESKTSDFGHIYTIAGLSKLNPTKWVALDSTLPGNNRFGYEVPFASNLDFPV